MHKCTNKLTYSIETEPADSFVCKHHDNIYIPWTPHANTNAISVSHGNSIGQYLYAIRTPWEHHANSYTRWEPMGTPWEPHGKPMGNPDFTAKYHGKV